MSSSSRQHVTITLGRNGQVVKRGSISDSSNFDDITVSGRKRSVRERLGSNGDEFGFYDARFEIKRQRRESDDSLYGREHIDGKTGNFDLRLKLERKGLSKRSSGSPKQNGIDLREKLQRSSRDSSRYDLREKALNRRDPGPVRPISSTKMSDDLFRSESMGKPYSSYMANVLRYRSPDRLVNAPRAAALPRNYESLRPGEYLRSLGTSGHLSSLTRDIYDRSMSMPYVNTATSSVVASQPSTRGLPSDSVHKDPVLPEEPLTVSKLMHSLGLSKYNISLQAEEVDMHALMQMSDKDLKDLGIPMGPRKKIILAVASLPRQRYR